MCRSSAAQCLYLIQLFPYNSLFISCVQSVAIQSTLWALWQVKIEVPLTINFRVAAVGAGSNARQRIGRLWLGALIPKYSLNTLDTMAGHYKSTLVRYSY